MTRVAIGLALLLVVLGGGGGGHCWPKSGATLDDFNRDSSACAKAASPAYGIVVQDQYRDCLRTRGWTRDQQQEPPPPGWFRGIE